MFAVVPRDVYRKVGRTEVETIERTVYDKVIETEYDTIKRVVIDYVNKTVTDTRKKVVYDTVEEEYDVTRVEYVSNDSGDGEESGAYDIEVSSDSSNSTYCRIGNPWRRGYGRGYGIGEGHTGSPIVT